MPLDELKRLIATHAARDVIPVDGLKLSMVDEPTAPASSIARPILAMVAQGSKRLIFNDQVFDYGAGDYLVVTVDVPVTGHFVGASRSAPCLGVGLELRPDVIASLLLESSTPGRRATDRPAGATPALMVDQASPELFDAMLRLVRLIERPQDIPVLAPMIEREIAWRLLNSRMGSVIREIGLADSSLSTIGAAIRWIRENPAEAFRVEDLAERANMSPSTFHRRFRALTTLSPVQFQKKVRLQQARLMLLAREAGVAEAGYNVGYDNPSQFSREYRREFGSPPGQDAARLRTTAPMSVSSSLP